MFANDVVGADWGTQNIWWESTDLNLLGNYHISAWVRSIWNSDQYLLPLYKSPKTLK